MLHKATFQATCLTILSAKELGWTSSDSSSRQFSSKIREWVTLKNGLTSLIIQGSVVLKRTVSDSDW